MRSLSDRQVTVTVKLRDGETVRGWIEYFDDAMLRLTREGQPNLFIYKHQIRSISETGRSETGRKRSPRTENASGAKSNGLDTSSSGSNGSGSGKSGSDRSGAERSVTTKAAS